MKKGDVPVLLRTAPLAAIMKVTTCSERTGHIAGTKRSRGEVEKLLRLAFHLQPHVLVFLVAGDPGDPLHEIED